MAMGDYSSLRYYPRPPVGQGSTWMDEFQVARYSGTGAPLDLSPKALRNERDRARRAARHTERAAKHD